MGVVSALKGGGSRGQVERTIEVAEQKGGDLHVQLVGKLLQRRSKVGALQLVAMLRKGGVDGDQQHSMGQTRAWWDADGMKTTQGVQMTPGGALWQGRGYSYTSCGDEAHAAGATM